MKAFPNFPIDQFPNFIAICFCVFGLFSCQQATTPYTSINDPREIFTKGQKTDIRNNIQLLEANSDFEFVIITTVDDIPNEGFLKEKQASMGIGSKSGGNFVIFAINPLLNKVGFFFDAVGDGAAQQEEILTDLLSPLAVQAGADHDYYKFMRQALCTLNDALVLKVDKSELTACAIDGKTFFNLAGVYQAEQKNELAFEYYTMAIAADYKVVESSEMRAEVFQQLARTSKEAARLETVIMREEAVAFTKLVGESVDTAIMAVQPFLDDVAVITKGFDTVQVAQWVKPLREKHKLALDESLRAIRKLQNLPEFDESIKYRRSYLEYLEYIESGLRETFEEWLVAFESAEGKGPTNKTPVKDKLEGLIAPFLKKMQKKGMDANVVYGQLAGKYGLY